VFVRLLGNCLLWSIVYFRQFFENYGRGPFLGNFFPRKNVCIKFDKNGVGYFWGDCFHNLIWPLWLEGVCMYLMYECMNVCMYVCIKINKNEVGYILGDFFQKLIWSPWFVGSGSRSVIFLGSAV
jgi:hypothetical protein